MLYLLLSPLDPRSRYNWWQRRDFKWTL